ncbi:MAG: hypothetical protein CMH61_00965 [Nanoarchaeota archaeon]|nr:hypothetical protein [Nanoarchaeota archaeon]|tara:strand:+ start:69 stop:581 length:513 start_codon:yes stop_codon:yes gene_type:complete
MDVQQIQKINTLALDLMKQGLATSKDEAVKQAESLLEKKDYSSLKDQMEVTEPKVEETEKPTVHLNQQTISDIMSRNSEFLTKTIRDFQEKMQRMEEQMNDLRKQVSQMNPPTQEVVQPKVETQQSLEPETPKVEQPVPQQAVPQSPRQPAPGFNDSDVSVEKMFYMGSK